MKRIVPFIFVFLIAYGNADYFTLKINSEVWETTCPMMFDIDYLPVGTHRVTIEPHLYAPHTSVVVDGIITKKENKKFEFWALIPQPGDEIYFNNDLLKIRVEK